MGPALDQVKDRIAQLRNLPSDSEIPEVSLVGILDADLYGPTIPKLFGISGSSMYLDTRTEKILPVVTVMGIKVVSMDFLLPSEETALIWRGPLVTAAIRDFLAHVLWGELDVLLVDLPPGTGDAPLTIAQLIADKITGSIIVTIPSEVSKRIVRKAIDFSRKLNIPIVGLIENMAYFICPKCGEVYHIFGKDIGKKLAEEEGIPFLGEIPLDPRISQTCDEGIPFPLKYPDSETTSKILAIVDNIISRIKHQLLKQ